MTAQLIDGNALSRQVRQDIAQRAAGGPVSANTPYIVGEVGPELFVPGGSGSIIPADKSAAMMAGGAGVNVTYNFTINGTQTMTPDQVIEAAKRYEKRNGIGWRS